MAARPWAPTNFIPYEDEEPASLELPDEELRSTVASMAHLVPGSVKLRSSSSEAGRVWLTFYINALAACRVSVFLVDSEDTVTGAIDRAATASLAYDSGLQQPFRHAMARDRLLHHNACILIRVESFIASHASFSPSALPAPGAALMHHTNAHTVVCCPRPQRGGAWFMEVLNERLWLAGIPYSLPHGLPLISAIDTTPNPRHQRLLWPQVPVQQPLHPQLLPPPPQQELWPLQQQELWPLQQYHPWQQQQQWLQQQAWPAPVFHPAPRAPSYCLLCPKRAQRPPAMQNTRCQHVCMCEPCGMARHRSRTPYCPMCGQALESLLLVSAPIA